MIITFIICQCLVLFFYKVHGSTNKVQRISHLFFCATKRKKNKKKKTRKKMVKVYLFPSMFFLPSLMKNKYVKKGRESEPSFKFLHIKTYTNAGISIKLMFSELNKVEFGGRSSLSILSHFFLWWFHWLVSPLYLFCLCS